MVTVAVIIPPPIGERSIVMSVSVSVCVCVYLSVIIYSDQHVRSSPNFLCMLHMTVARSFSGGEVLRYVLPVLWITSYLLISQGCSTSRPAEAQCTRSLGLGYKMCVVVPVAGQRTHETTFRALKVISRVATQGGVCGL